MDGHDNISELVERRNRSVAEQTRLEEELADLDGKILRHILAESAWEVWRDFGRLGNASITGDTLPERFMAYLNDRIEDEGTRELLGLPSLSRNEPAPETAEAEGDQSLNGQEFSNRLAEAVEGNATESAPATP